MWSETWHSSEKGAGSHAVLIICASLPCRKAKGLTEAFAKVGGGAYSRTGLSGRYRFKVHTAAAMQLDVTLTGHLSEQSKPFHAELLHAARSLGDSRSAEYRVSVPAFVELCFAMLRTCWKGEGSALTARHVWIAHVGDCRCVLAVQTSE